MRVEEDLYRSCVPGPDPRPLAVRVRDHRPAPAGRHRATPTRRPTPPTGCTAASARLAPLPLCAAVRGDALDGCAMDGGETQATLRVSDACHGNRLDIASAGARAEPRSRRLTGRRRLVLPALRLGAARLPRLARPRRRRAGRDDRDARARRQGRRPRRVRPAARRSPPPSPRARAAPAATDPPRAAAPRRAARPRPRSRRARTRPRRSAPAPVAAPAPAAAQPAAAAPGAAGARDRAAARAQPGPVEAPVETASRRAARRRRSRPSSQEPVQPVLDTVQQVGRTVDETAGPLLPALP